MVNIHHPKSFKKNTRVLMSVSRTKDTGSNAMSKTLISYSECEFDLNLKKLRDNLEDNQRIYSTASSLDIKKAARKFKERQLDSEYEQDPMRFYRRLKKTWVSCLMKSEFDKKWLFDCDSEMEYAVVTNDLQRLNVKGYEYKTKNGHHVIVSPFNKSGLRFDSIECLMTNPLILWTY